MADRWTVAEAKAKFSEVIDRAAREGPQTVTRNGRTAAVVVASEEWERKTKRTVNLAEFLRTSPLRRPGPFHRLGGRRRLGHDGRPTKADGSANRYDGCLGRRDGGRPPTDARHAEQRRLQGVWNDHLRPLDRTVLMQSLFFGTR